MSSPATQKSQAQLAATSPAVTRIAPLAYLRPSLPARTLLHAGPPFADPRDLPTPVFNSVAAACRHEGWAETPNAVSDALADGTVFLAAAQDHDVVTPLAFVVGPSMYSLEVSDLAAPGRSKISPLNDGPLPYALRLGAGHDEGVAIVQRLTDGLGAEMAAHLRAPVPLLPILASAIAAGDDLHGRVDAAQMSVRGLFDDGLSPQAEGYLEQANQFVLNIIMAGSAVMIAAGAGVPESQMVVAVGGNGREMGWKLAGNERTWITAHATAPVGGRMPGHEGIDPLPAIGDSAVIDAVGFGAACLRFAPALAQTLAAHIPADFFTEEAHAPFIGQHPELPESVHVGLDLTRSRRVLGIMLGMVGPKGEGLIGRGVAPWPV
jgi:hypothetical protein